MTTVLVPVLIVSVANVREHFMARAARAKKQRKDAWYALLASRLPIPTLPVAVTLTRLYGPPKRRMDADNCVSGMKALVDGVADWLGVDDGDQRITWKFEQERTSTDMGGWVRVTFEEP